jgi:transposase
MQTKLRTNEFEPNENISFPIGTIFLVDKLYEVLNFSDIFGKHKTRGIDINNLLRALISYKLTDNFSIKKSHDWINRPEVLAEFSLPNFSERSRITRRNYFRPVFHELDVNLSIHPALMFYNP